MNQEVTESVIVAGERTLFSEELMTRPIPICARTAGDLVNMTANAYPDVTHGQTAQACDRAYWAFEELAKHMPNSASASVTRVKTAMKMVDSPYEGNKHV